MCEIGKTTQKTNIHGLQACVERRKTPPTKVCTTLRVSTQSSKNIFWAEVKAAESLAHKQIIRDIASAIMKGDISSMRERGGPSSGPRGRAVGHA